MTKVIQNAFEFWKDSDFSQLLKDLDAIAAEIAEDKDQNETSRKILVEKNRKFKEQVSLDARREVAPLLKSFQSEVDNLSKRNKTLETHILSLYKKLIDLPDPYPALEQAVASQKKLQKSQDILLENKKLRESLEEYHKEFSDIKNQEVTVKNLRDKVKELETSMSSNIDSKFREREKDLLIMYSDKEREIIGEKMELQEKMKEAEYKLHTTELNLSNAQAELFQAKMKLDDYVSAKTSEIELLITENDRMMERIKEMEGQLVNMRKEKQKLFENTDNMSDDKKSAIEANREREINDLQSELITRQTEIMKLGEENRKAHAIFVKAENQLKTEIDNLETIIKAKNQEINEYQLKINQRNDYDEIKRELDIIKSIEFSDLINEKDDGNDKMIVASNIKTKSLEKLLMEKNRQMQSELLRERSNHEISKKELSELREQCADHIRQNNDKQLLINRLEEDLNNIKSFSSIFRDSGEGCDGGEDQHLTGSEVNSLTCKSSEVSGHTAQHQPMTKSSEILSYIIENDTQKISGQDNDQRKSFVTIVQSQRDRFKKRAQDLESMCSTFQLQMKSLEDEVERVKQDNVKLYEKIRFLQSHPDAKGNDREDSVMSQYSSEYKVRLNPFETFSRRERMRQYQILPTHEKIMFSLGKFIMGNRTARLFAFLYSILLHFLIFIVLYKLASTETCVRDQALACERKFAEHMLKAHGQKR